MSSASQEELASGDQASYFAKPTLDDMGPGTDMPVPTGKSLFRKNTLDEMTVGRTEKPVVGKLPERPDASPSNGSRGESTRTANEGQPNDPRPLIRGKVGAGSYEDPGEQKRKGRTKGKTGRPGR